MQGLLALVVLPAPRQLPAGHENAPVTTVLATTAAVGAALTEKVERGVTVRDVYVGEPVNVHKLVAHVESVLILKLLGVGEHTNTPAPVVDTELSVAQLVTPAHPPHDAAVPVPSEKATGCPCARVPTEAVTVLAVATMEVTAVAVPVPPGVPVSCAVMVQPEGTLAPEIAIPGTITPDVNDATVSVVELAGMAPRKTGAVTAAMDVPALTATVGAALTTHVHGTVALEQVPPSMEVTVVPKGTLMPDSVMPTRSVPDATAVTLSVVELIGMAPVMAAVGSDGLTPSPAGQKKPAGHAFKVPTV